MRPIKLLLLALVVFAAVACHPDIMVMNTVTVNSGDTTKKSSPTDTTTHPDTTTHVVPVTGVTVSPSSVALSVGALCINTATQIVVTVQPQNATNQGFRFAITNHGSATLSPTGLLTAIAVGVDTVSVVSVDNPSAKAFVVVTVTNTSCAPVTGIHIILVPDHGSGPKGTTGQVTAVVTAPTGVNKAVIWYSTGPNVVAVAQKDGDAITINGQIILANVKGGTLYFVFPGTVQICAQSVADPTVRACGPWTTTP